MGLLSKLKKVVKSGPPKPKDVLKNPNVLLKPVADLSPLGSKDPVSKLLGLSTTKAQAMQAAAQNPFAQAMQAGTFIPGYGYVNRDGQGQGNPFQQMMSQIPQGFFSSPQAQQMLAQALGQGQPPQKPAYVAPWAMNKGGTPGPFPSAQTLMGQVGGLGNGGGKMAPPMDFSKLPIK